MSISNVSGVGVNPYAYANSSQKAAGTGNFAEEMQKAAEGKNASEKSGSSAWAGDMVVSNPPSYFGFTYDSSISNKPKEEMTTDEYKQWFMNEMSKMPVSSWFRSSFSSGSLVIKEEAFERMKNDPEYEKYVLNRIRSMYSVSSLPVGSNNVCYEVIGASPEECYGYAGPVGGSGSNFASNEKSWWEKRHERMEELMEEQEKEAVKKAQVRRAVAQENYLKSQMASRQRQQAFLAEGVQNGDDAAVFQSAGVSALAATAYEENISIFSKSVVGSQKM
ncbi:hypothetical protein D7V82_15600 [bacterium 1xD8-6]|nr:hypothetical protein D7V72_17065 [bacterium D16-36]RKI66022.1 hypothetical protein D7V82_15600 [bacterium 1xD8-6]